MNEATQAFIDRIVSNLAANGFPAKRVALPTEKMYEAADNSGLSLNTVLEEMRKDGVESEIGPDRIIFTRAQAPANSFSGLDIDALKNMDQAELMKKAQEMMSSMSPEQMNEMRSMYENMSAEEKEEVMKKGKEMGLV